MQGDTWVAPIQWGEHEIRGPVHRYRERLLLRHFRRHLDRGRVLDAGCGSGSLLFELLRAGYAVTGVEAAADFVARLRQQAMRLGVSGLLDIHHGQVTRIECADGSFDGIICGEVLEHVLPEHGGDTAAVTEFRRLLRPGGICAVSVPLGPGQWDHTDEWARHVKRYERAELVRLLGDHGLEVRVVRSWGFPLGRLYHRLVFAPWVRRTAGSPVAQRESRIDTRCGRHPLVMRSLAAVLRLDELFGRLSWGRGLIAVARTAGQDRGSSVPQGKVVPQGKADPDAQNTGR